MLALLSLGLAGVALADSHAPPPKEPEDIARGSAAFAFFVQDVGPRGTEHTEGWLVEKASGRVRWRNPLPARPAEAYVSPSGAVVTLDLSWGADVGDQVVVLYGPAGLPLAHYSLEQLLTEEELIGVARSVSSRRWRDPRQPPVFTGNRLSVVAVFEGRARSRTLDFDCLTGRYLNPSTEPRPTVAELEQRVRSGTKDAGIALRLLLQRSPAETTASWPRLVADAALPWRLRGDALEGLQRAATIEELLALGALTGRDADFDARLLNAIQRKKPSAGATLALVQLRDPKTPPNERGDAMRAFLEAGAEPEQVVRDALRGPDVVLQRPVLDWYRQHPRLTLLDDVVALLGSEEVGSEARWALALAVRTPGPDRAELTQRLMRRAPTLGDAAMLVELGRVAEAGGDEDAAASLYTRATTLHRTHSEEEAAGRQPCPSRSAWLRLAWQALLRQRVDEAKALLARVEPAPPQVAVCGGPDEDGQEGNCRGWVDRERERLLEALEAPVRLRVRRAGPSVELELSNVSGAALELTGPNLRARWFDTGRKCHPNQENVFRASPSWSGALPAGQVAKGTFTLPTSPCGAGDDALLLVDLEVQAWPKGGKAISLPFRLAVPRAEAAAWADPAPKMMLQDSLKQLELIRKIRADALDAGRR